MSTKTGNMIGNSVLYQKIAEEQWEWLKNFIERLPFTQRNPLVDTLLHEAIWKGAPSDLIIKLISSYNINLKYEKVASNTALHLAVLLDKWDLVPILVSSGADINVENGSGDVPLHIALSHDAPLDVLKQLISSENVNKRNLLGASPFHNSVLSKNWSAAEVLKNNRAYLNLVDIKNMTPPSHAIKQETPPAVIDQVMTLQNISIKDTTGETPLHRALMNEKWELIDVLLCKGADINMLNTKQKLSPLHVALIRDAPSNVITQLVSPSVINLLPVDKRMKKTVLHFAVVLKRWDLVEYFIQQGADINGLDGEQNTPLHDAVFYYNEATSIELLLKPAGRDNNIKIIEKLITPQNINLRNAAGKTPLHMAMEQMLWDPLVALLLENGADLSVQYMGCPLWHIAVWWGVPKHIFSYVTFSSSQDINILDEDNCPPLSIVANKRWDLVPIFLRNGVDINLKNTSGRTFLHDAIQQKAPIHIVHWLFSTHKPNIDIQNNDGDAALHLAAKAGRWDLVAFFLNFRPNLDLANVHNCTPVHLAIIGIMKNHYSVDPYIIDQLSSPQNMNMYDDSGYTPLHVVTCPRLWDLVPVLLQNGADINLPTIQTDSTPLQIALSYPNVPKQTISVLMSPQNINMRLGSHSTTALHKIVSEKWWDLVPLFLQHGGDINIVDQQTNISPLYLASKYDVPEDIFPMLIYPENINIQTTNNRRTPLHQAVVHAQWGLVPILIGHGADVNLLDHSDSAPLHLAIDLELHTPQYIITHLMSAQNIDKADSHGQTPLHLAAACGRNSLVQLLLHHEADPTKDLGFRPEVSLKGICIAAVRRHMSVRTDTAIQTLGLPRALVDEVKMIGLAHQFVSWWKKDMAAKETAAQD